MIMNRRFLTLLAGTATLLSSPAPAQDGQTVEGAQRFLSIVLPGSGYLPSSARSGIASARDAAAAEGQGVRADLYGRARITDMSAVAHCVSRLEFDEANMRAVFIARNGERQEITLSTMWDQPVPYGKDPEGFHWGKDVLAASQSGSQVNLRLEGRTQDAIIYLGDEAMAQRVIYAITFLRTECDAAADTGF